MKCEDDNNNDKVRCIFATYNTIIIIITTT